LPGSPAALVGRCARLSPIEALAPAREDGARHRSAHVQACSCEFQYQPVPLTQLLPVEMTFEEVLAGGVCRLSSHAEALVNELCDHVAEI
jgi:hypothetical protein